MPNEPIQTWEKLGPGILSIDLINQDFKSAIYISDNEDDRNRLTIKVKNIGNQTIILTKTEAAHLEFLAPTGILDHKNLPTTNQINVKEWSGVSGKDLFNFGAIADQPILDMAHLNEKTKINTSPLVESIQSREALHRPSTSSRNIRSRNVADESKLTEMVKKSNDLKQSVLSEIKDIQGNRNLTRSPIIQQGLSKFQSLFTKLSELSNQVDNSLVELVELQKEVENDKKTNKEEIFNFIQEELASGISDYLEGLEGQGLFSNAVEIKMKDLLKGFENIQLSDDMMNKMSSEKENKSDWIADYSIIDQGVLFKITKKNDEPIVLKSGDYLEIHIANLKVNPKGGTRNANVEVRYPSIQIEGSKAQINRFSQLTLKIENHRGQKHPALQLSVIEGQKILNDGVTPNKIILRLINNSQNALFFQNTRLEITYEVQQEGENEAYALANKDDAVTVQLFNSDNQPLTNALNNSGEANSFLNEAEVGGNPLYVCQIGKKQGIKSGDYWLIILDNVKSNIKAGFANIRFNYKNLPEYWDGSLVATVERSPQFFAEKNVGIGTLTPTSKIHIKGDKQLLTLEGKEKSTIEFQRNQDTASIGIDKKSNDFNINSPTGNIHLKTNEQVIINNDVPFQFKRFEVSSVETDTNYPVKSWNSAISGWQMTSIKNGSETLRMEIGDNGNWFIHAKNPNNKAVTVDVMFVSKVLSTRFNW